MGPNQAKNMPGQRSALHSSLNTSHITSQTKTVIPIMNIQFRIHGLNANAGLRRWLEQQLERFHSLIPVSAAEVLLERERDAAPGFRAHVHLAVPGPDIHAAARDHTLEAAWLKVARNLRQQIGRRNGRRLLKQKSNRSSSVPASRWSGTPVAGQM